MPTKQEANKETIRRFNREFIQEGKLEVYDEVVSPEFHNHTAHDGRDSGPEGARFFFTQILRPAFPDLEVTIHDQVAEGDQVVTRKSYSATHQGEFMGVPATGKKISFAVIDIIKLRDGKYIEHWASADMFGLMQQIRGGLS